MEAGQRAYMWRCNFRRGGWWACLFFRTVLFHLQDLLKHLPLRWLTSGSLGEGELAFDQRDSNRLPGDDEQVLELALEAFMEVLRHQVTALTQEHLGEKLASVGRYVSFAIQAG